MNGKIILIIIIIFFGLIGFGTFKSLQHDEQIKNNKIAFCNLEGMDFRTKNCGFVCLEDQCYGNQGVFELEETNYGGYVLIGYLGGSE